MKMLGWGVLRKESAQDIYEVFSTLEEAIQNAGDSKDIAPAFETSMEIYDEADAYAKPVKLTDGRTADVARPGWAKKAGFISPDEFRTLRIWLKSR